MAIRTNATPAKIATGYFEDYDYAGRSSRLEKVAPFSSGGNKQTREFRPVKLTRGEKQIEFPPFEGRRGTGTVGTKAIMFIYGD